MKKLLMIMIVVCLVCCVDVFGRTFVVAGCNSPPTLDPNDVPFDYEPNDAPERLIAWAEILVLQEYTFEAFTCDPETDPVFTFPTYQPYGMVWDMNTGIYTWTPQPSQIGVHWVAIEATDEPPEGSTPKSDYVSMVINVVPRPNEKPVIRFLE